MDMTLVYTVIGFALAGYSVIANDSIQTLGTFIASKKKWFKWYTLAGSASAIMIFALGWGWYAYDGDISYGRLTRIPFQEIQWYLSLIHISEPTRRTPISYAVFCLKKKWK